MADGMLFSRLATAYSRGWVVSAG